MASIGNHFGRLLLSIGKIFALFLVFEVYSLQHVDAELTALSMIGKSASQRKTYVYDNWKAAKGVDGKTSSYFSTAAADPFPWWRVDMDTEHQLGNITVTLRTDSCCGEGFIGAVARAGLSPNVTDNQQCGLPATVEQSKTGAVITFNCDPAVTAKYVSLDIDPSQPLVVHTLLEVAEVTVENATSSVVFLQGGKTSQSTNIGDQFVASMAIDGNLETYSATAGGGLTVRAGVNLTPTENQQCGSPATAEQFVKGVMVGFMCDPPVKAKYVSLDINAKGKLDITEVTVEEENADKCLPEGVTSASPTNAGVTFTKPSPAQAITDALSNTAGLTVTEPSPAQAGSSASLSTAGVTVTEPSSTQAVTSAPPTTAGVTVTKSSPTQAVTDAPPTTAGVTVTEPGPTQAVTDAPPTTAGVTVTKSSPTQAVTDAPPTTAGVTVTEPGPTQAVTDAPPTTAGVTVTKSSPTQAVTDAPPTTAGVTVTEPGPTQAGTSASPTTAGVTITKSSPTQVVDYPEFLSGYYNRIYKGSSIGNPDPLSTEVAWNLKRCAAHCVVHDLCYIFDFSPRTGRCHLYKLLDKVIPKPDSDFFIYELAKCLSKLSICKN
ncbi:mucin-2-like [Asterias rubens]|uniref:mucin-2-like n=1 Tax=Asterias rubens TaxID=7604 RepID=UPI001455D83C|nr:mucin-2-like [Asterias rubens]